MTRQVLENRRPAETIEMLFRGQDYCITLSRYPDGRVAEVFIDPWKQSTDMADDARDAALVLSLALQHGTPIETIKHAVTRDLQGRPAGVIGAALDAIEGTRQ